MTPMSGCTPSRPLFFISDGKGFTRPLTPVDSPIIDDTELLEWTVQAAVAPYNVDYFNYAKELNTASRSSRCAAGTRSPAAMWHRATSTN